MIKISPLLWLPGEIATSTTAVLGIRGSGKTNTAGVICEGLLKAGQPVCVIDPLDVWWGIKSSADGQSEGFPVPIFGGHHADIEIDESSAKPLAALVAEQSLPCVISIRHLAKAAQRRFVADFCAELYHVKGRAENRTPLLVVIDEASSFVPQRVQGDVARCVGAVEDLVRRGRSSGIGVMAIDQRAASVNKDVLTQAEILIAHRHTSPQDREALKAWVSANASTEQMQDFLTSLASLGKGEAWVWSPHFEIFERSQIDLRSTFDSSATPKPGESVAPRALAQIDIGAISASLAKSAEPESPQKADENKGEIRKLERKVAELQAELKRCRERLAMNEMVFREIAAIAQQLASFVGESAETQELLRKAGEKMTPVETTQVIELPVASQGVTGPQMRMLEALAKFGPLRKRNLAVLSGQSPKSSGYAKNLSTLSSAGMVTRGDEISLTGEGASMVPGVKKIGTSSELQKAWLGYVSGPQARMLKVLLADRTAWISKEVLASQTGQSIKSSGFAKNLSTLASLGLVVRNGQDVQVSSELFL